MSSIRGYAFRRVFVPEVSYEDIWHATSSFFNSASPHLAIWADFIGDEVMRDSNGSMNRFFKRHSCYRAQFLGSATARCPGRRSFVFFQCLSNSNKYDHDHDHYVVIFRTLTDLRQTISLANAEDVMNS